MSKQVSFVQQPRKSWKTEDRPSPQERTKELLGQLESEVTALTDSEAWQRFLTMQGKLHKYSFGNVLLIHAQYPDATYVAGYQAWRSLGRFVRKGQTGIKILVPYVFKRESKAEDGSAEEPQAYVRFGVGHVFDISQTDGDETVIDWGWARGQQHEAGLGLGKLEAYAGSLGFTVERVNEPGGTRGHCDFKQRRIVLDAGLDIVNQTAVLAHELAHALLHDGITDYQVQRGKYECEAESVAYVVVTALGLDASACSLPYLASWAGGNVKALREVAQRVHETATKLVAIADVADIDAKVPVAA